MERRQQLKNLRGMDVITLQVTIIDVVRRPIRQIEPSSLMDLLALAEAEGLSESIIREMEGFTDRVKKELSDIPTGELWTGAIAEFNEIDPARVPNVFRTFFKAQVEERGGLVDPNATAMLLAWDGAEPDVFVVSKQEAKVERTTKVAKAKGVSAEKASKSPKKRTTTKKEVDPVRQKFLRTMCLERLRGYIENGLSEKILVTGIAFAAKKTYTDLSPAEVIAAMKTLEADGLARRTAGRWILGRIW